MESKKCNCCEKIKPTVDFRCSFVKNKAYYRFKCKECCAIDKLAWSRTVKGVIFKIYSDQKSSSKGRGHQPPNYTRQEFFNWIIIQNVFHNLYHDWVNSGYEKAIIPSCDRFNDYQPYTLDSIRVVTWIENKRKHYSDMKNGLNNKTSKSVIKEDKNGDFIDRYYSISEAGRQNGISQSDITMCCKGKRKTTGGYKWRYANPE